MPPEDAFDAHWHAFRVFEGVPGRGIYDNMRTAVDRVGVGKKRDVNARFEDWRSCARSLSNGNSIKAVAYWQPVLEE
jgi:transposase